MAPLFARSAAAMVPSTISPDIISVPRVAETVPVAMLIPVPAEYVVSLSEAHAKLVPFHLSI